MRLSSRSASRASPTSGSTRYRGRRSRLRHARYSKRSCRNAPWLSSSARGPLGSRVLAGLHTRRAQCYFSPLFGASRRRAAPGSQAIEDPARMLRLRSSVLAQERAAHGLVCSASGTLHTLRNKHWPAVKAIHQVLSEVSSKRFPAGALTLPSSGHPTARHTGSLRQVR